MTVKTPASVAAVLIAKGADGAVRVTPEHIMPSGAAHGGMAGRAEILGDIEAPVLPPLDEFIDNNLD